jgi:hypothetical protein
MQLVLVRLRVLVLLRLRAVVVVVVVVVVVLLILLILFLDRQLVLVVAVARVVLLGTRLRCSLGMTEEQECPGRVQGAVDECLGGVDVLGSRVAQPHALERASSMLDRAHDSVRLQLVVDRSRIGSGAPLVGTGTPAVHQVALFKHPEVASAGSLADELRLGVLNVAQREHRGARRAEGRLRALQKKKVMADKAGPQPWNGPAPPSVTGHISSTTGKKVSVGLVP